MNVIDRIMDALKLYDEEELDEELELKKPLAKNGANAASEEKAERASLFRKKNIGAEQPAAPASDAAAPRERGKKSFLSFKSPAAKEAPAQQRSEEGKAADAAGKMSSRTLNLPVANKLVNVVVLEPVSFDDSQKVADYLCGSKPVVVNYKGTDNVVAKRMTDYISGTIYALGGSMKKLGRDVLICAPKNVDIDAGEEMYDERGEQPWKK